MTEDAFKETYIDPAMRRLAHKIMTSQSLTEFEVKVCEACGIDVAHYGSVLVIAPAPADSVAPAPPLSADVLGLKPESEPQ